MRKPASSRTRRTHKTHKTGRERTNRLAREIADKERRKLEHRSREVPNLWAHLGLFGIVGWAVSLPTVLGALAGRWLDSQSPQQFSWTVALLLSGLFVGCMIAWHWMAREHRRAADEHARERAGNGDGDPGDPQD